MKGDKYHYNQRNNDLLVQFATGMNGDEDLGQDIIMKGEKFHYNQANTPKPHGFEKMNVYIVKRIRIQ